MAVAPELDVFTGISFTFSEAPLLAARKIVDVKLPGSTIVTFDSSDQSTTGAKTKIPADLPENSAFEFTVKHKQDLDAQSEIGAEGELVVTLPHTGSVITFDGIYASYEPQNTTLNEPGFADVVIEVSGDIAYTVAA